MAVYFTGRINSYSGIYRIWFCLSFKAECTVKYPFDATRKVGFSLKEIADIKLHIAHVGINRNQIAFCGYVCGKAKLFAAKNVELSRGENKIMVIS